MKKPKMMQFSFSRFLYQVLPRPESIERPAVHAAVQNKIAPVMRPDMTEIDFHREVQDEMVQALRSNGVKVEENIRLTAPQPTPGGGYWLYDADWIAKSATQPTVIRV